MEVQFPPLPLYQDWGRPLRCETTIEGLELIQGKVPAGIEGTWYRCGPDRQYPPMNGEDIFIDGEGMMHRFRFDHGHVSYRSRWVRNARFNVQASARRSLFGRYRNRYTNDPSVEGVHMGTSNTNVVFHAGKCLVLKEDGLPYAIDPDTLETGGVFDFDGQIKALSLSAHPKVDVINDRLLIHSFQARGDATRDIAFYEIDNRGRVVDEIWLEAPYASVVHDFAVTPEYVVFPFFPLITDLEHIKAGGTFYRWHPDEKTVVAIVPRRGKGKGIRWYRGPATSAGHMMNAFRTGSKVHLDLCLYAGNCFPFFPTPTGAHTQPVPPVLTRMSFDLESQRDEFESRPITLTPGEMPRTDDRYQGLPYKHGYLIVARGPEGGSATGHVDVVTGVVSSYSFGPRTGVHEAQFVPRTADSVEGDGWLLVIVNHMDANHSDLAILNALDVAAGPVATLRLPVRVRSTFHGTWVPAETLATGVYRQAPHT
jgi:carotenoid cleavage dioxygenase-like enzyme